MLSVFCGGNTDDRRNKGEIKILEKLLKMGNAIKNCLKGIVKDIWVVLLDIIAVNAAYYLTLLIRFYVNFQMNPGALGHLEDFWHFAPYYTVCCIIVFAIFRLYNNMWKYAGINDMHRILLANLVTCVIQVAGTLLFVNKMPLTYYVIGAVLQACFIIAIRFAYRVIVIERQKVKARKQPSINAMVVGAGEFGRRVIKYLEQCSGYRVLCVVDTAGSTSGTQLDGIPIISGMERIEEAIQKYEIKAVFISNPALSPESRQRIKDFCKQKDLELLDYAGFLANLGGNVALARLLELVQGPVILKNEQEEKQYCSNEEAIQDLKEHYQVKAVSVQSGQLVIELTSFQPESNMTSEAWIQQYKEETGEDVSFF